MTSNVDVAHGGFPAAAVSTTGAWRLVGLGVTVCAAYYAGAAVGFALKLPNATPSVMWPPNAILTCALLLTHPRLWPFVLASALPAHIALEAGAGWPMALVLALFATNCIEALLAAGGLRWLSDAPTRFDSLRRVTIFLAVVPVAAPFLSSFLDAAAVSMVRDEPYWRVWTARLFSNALTAVTLVPAVVMCATTARVWLRTSSRSERTEAALLATAMVLVATVLLRGTGSDPMSTALTERAQMAWLLPVLLWAAIRLGPGALSVALLCSSLVLVGAAFHSHGPFQGLSSSDSTMALQLFMTAISFPLLVVAALVEERRLVQQNISERLAFEALLARVSGSFVQLPSDRMRTVFTESLRQIGEFLGLDRLMLFECPDPPRDLTLVSVWTAPGASDIREMLDRIDLRGPIERFRQRDTLRHEEVSRPESAFVRGHAPHGSTLDHLIPLIAEEKMLGALACTSTAATADRHAATIEQLQLIARVLANALARKRSEDSLRASEATKSAILASLTNGVVVVDRHGRIVTVNERWRQMVGDEAPATATQIGASYLEYYRAAARAGELWAADAAGGIEAVLFGATTDFRLEHVHRGPGGDRTFMIRAVPLERAEGGAVVTHVDLTDQRRAELEAQRARTELAHVSRVATMGALTASIAHQLNQPLTGILSNAQAARRFLAAAAPDLDEARASLEDIMEDDRRATEVILRMRDLLRKDDGLLADIDLNALVGDVVRLVSSDAIIRNVALVTQLEAGAAVVRGDRVQLQQVVLNLIVNALEAFGERRTRDRRVIVRSSLAARNLVEISVSDNATGFDGGEEFAFEAFHTTKAGGMGLGLSIARSVVEAHAGVIRAADNREGGATVSFRVPLAHRTTA